MLTILHTVLTDGGSYLCSAEYYLASADYHVIDLVVMVLPDKPRIFLDTGHMVEKTLVVVEGQYLSLNCASSGGSPPLRLVWWEKDQLLDETFRE